MSPHKTLTSPFLKELQAYLDELSEAKPHTHLPGSSTLELLHMHDPNRQCTTCHLQFTVGLKLVHVPKLLALSKDKKIKKTVAKVKEVCMARPQGCKPEYEGLLTMAAWNLRATQKCRSCGHPKRCVAPWLIRTHFGDMVNYISEKHGPDALATFAQDVLQAAEMTPDTLAIPKGLVDYIRLPEMAELSGMVISRSPLLTSLTGATTDMPTDVDGLLKLAARMLKKRKTVNKALRSRDCGVFGRSNETNPFTAQDWLSGMMQGKDIMSDHDSPISRNSFSGLVWKSMGSWRMRKGSGVVHLECRHATGCVKLQSRKSNGPVDLIRRVARTMVTFEQNITKKTHNSQRPK